MDMEKPPVSVMAAMAMASTRSQMYRPTAASDSNTMRLRESPSTAARREHTAPCLTCGLVLADQETPARRASVATLRPTSSTLRLKEPASIFSRCVDANEQQATSPRF